VFSFILRTNRKCHSAAVAEAVAEDFVVATGVDFVEVIGVDFVVVAAAEAEAAFEVVEEAVLVEIEMRARRKKLLNSAFIRIRAKIS